LRTPLRQVCLTPGVGPRGDLGQAGVDVVDGPVTVE
jgi:hypothetical protein